MNQQFLECEREQLEGIHPYISTLFDFRNKLFLITGGTSGIGLAATESLIQLGARVIVTGLNKTKLNELSNRHGSRVIPLNIDSASTSSGYDLAQVVQDHGKLDGLWLNAAIARLDKLESVTAEAYSEVMNVNVRGPILQLAALTEHLKDKASIVVTSSSSVYEGAKFTTLYAASKGALSAAVRVWSSELSSRGIRVNTLVPGPITTNLRRFLSDDEQIKFEETVVDQVPLGRAASASEVANVVLFLFSPSSSYITGSEIPVDGGLIMR
jgi:NAD(P)-dependent dehydrogenase (short-subunit alcohol dehydrogenase family)